MAALGRISGLLLVDNIQRNGNDLAFETNLLYFNTSNLCVGINTFGNAASTQLYVSSTINVNNNLKVTGTANLAEFTVSSNTIANTFDIINIRPNQSSNPTIIVPTLGTANLNFGTNIIGDSISGDNINFTPVSGGQVILNANTLVSGNLHATGNITFDGNITLGSTSSNTITFQDEISSSIVPTVTGTYNLGSSLLQWSNLYVNNFTASSNVLNTINNNSITAGSIFLTGNQIYNVNSGGNVVFAPNGIGKTNIDNFLTIASDTWTNTSGTALQFSSTGTGYWKFVGTSGVGIPVNTATNYTPPTGTIRYNSSSSIGQVWNGTAWQGWVSGATVTSASFQQTAIGLAIALGGL